MAKDNGRNFNLNTVASVFPINGPMAWVARPGGQPHLTVHKAVLFAGGFKQAVWVNAVDHHVVTVLNWTPHLVQGEADQNTAFREDLIHAVTLNRKAKHRGAGAL